MTGSINYMWKARSTSKQRMLIMLGSLAGFALGMAYVARKQSAVNDRSVSYRAWPYAADVYVDSKVIGPELNLIEGGAWNMAGAELTPSGLVLFPMISSIENRENGTYQPNYPINLYGTHLEVPNQFNVTIKIENSNGVAIHFYARPPLIRDDSRTDHGSVRIECGKGALTVKCWNGGKEPAVVQTFSIPDSSKPTKLTMGVATDTLALSIDGQAANTIKTLPVFSSEVWFGFDAQRSDTVIKSLQAASGSGDIRAVDTTTLKVERGHDRLQALANKRNPILRIGAASAPGPLFSDKIYAAIALGGDYGLFTTENVLKPVHLTPKEGIYTFEQADALVDIARTHNIDIHGHTLVFARSLPEWMRKLPTSTVAEKDRVKQVMTDYIHTVVKHFKGRVKSWDVINEPFVDYNGDSPKYRNHLWYKAMGSEYIEIALKAARAADPDALLFINENAIENDTMPGKKMRWDTLLKLAAEMKSKGILDGIGMQGHVYTPGRDRIRGSSIRRHMRQLEQLGLLGRISEIDVSLQAGSDTQAKQYAEALEACMAAPNCDGFIVWGVRRGYGNEGLPWDNDGRPDEAMYAMRRVLTR